MGGGRDVWVKIRASEAERVPSGTPRRAPQA